MAVKFRASYSVSGLDSRIELSIWSKVLFLYLGFCGKGRGFIVQGLGSTDHLHF